MSEPSANAGQDQPVVCAVCFNGFNFYGPKCTTNGKLIRQIEEKGNEVDKSAPKPEVGESTQEPEEDSKVVPGGRTSLMETRQDEPPISNPEENRTDNTLLIWLGIGGLILCPFIIVIANGVYK